MAIVVERRLQSVNVLELLGELWAGVRSGGTAAVARKGDRDEDFEVDTPNQAFSILQAGQYRVQVSEDGNSTLVTVRAGMGEVTGGGRTYSVGSGLSGNFTGTDSLRADIFKTGGNDEFDNWSQDRDRHDDGSRSARYVSRDVVGYEDLDDNGSWRSEADYGDVWVPRVYAGWAPYRDGHWAWISPWGWTWVDDAPWGYAPFHYGRWVYARNDWCWVPGPIAVRPVYAPALVVFVGGPSFGLSISVGGGRSGGNVGWFPLGPREVYVPAYNTSREYVTRVNVSNTTVNNTTVINVYNNQVTNNGRGNNNGNQRNNSEIKYANRNVAGGVTVVSQNTFTSAQPVSRAVIAVNQREIAAAPISRRAEVAPTRNSVFGTSAPGGSHVPQPSSEVSSRSVVAKRPPPPPPVPFEEQQQKLSAQPGQPLARDEVEGLRPANVPAVQPHVRQAPPGKPAKADSNQPMGQPANPKPPNPAPAIVGSNPPVRNDRPNRSDRRGQPADLPPSSPAPAKVDANPPANNIPPARNDHTNGANRGQPANAEPSSPAPANVGAAPPANNAPPTRGNRPNRENRAQPADKAASTSDSLRPAQQQATQPPKDQPQEQAKDKKARGKQKQQDEQPPQR